MTKTFFIYLCGTIIGLLLPYVINWLIIATTNNPTGYIELWAGAHNAISISGHAFYQELSSNFLTLTPLLFVGIIWWAILVVRNGDIKAHQSALGITSSIIIYIVIIAPYLDYAKSIYSAEISLIISYICWFASPFFIISCMVLTRDLFSDKINYRTEENKPYSLRRKILFIFAGGVFGNYSLGPLFIGAKLIAIILNIPTLFSDESGKISTIVVMSLLALESNEEIFWDLKRYPFIWSGIVFGYEVAQGRLSLKRIIIGISLGLIFYAVVITLCRGWVFAPTISDDSRIIRIYLRNILLPVFILITTLGFNYFWVTTSARKKRKDLLKKTLEESPV